MPAGFPAPALPLLGVSLGFKGDWVCTGAGWGAETVEGQRAVPTLAIGPTVLTKPSFPRARGDWCSTRAWKMTGSVSRA